MADLVEGLMESPVSWLWRPGGEHAAAARSRGKPGYLLYYGETLEAGELRKLAFEGKATEPGVRGPSPPDGRRGRA